MVQLVRTRRFEGINLTTRRIHPGHDMLDEAVLACGVDALQDHKHRLAIVRVEAVLQFLEAGEVLLLQLFRLFPVERTFAVGVVILKAKAFGLGSKLFGEVHRCTDQVSRCSLTGNKTNGVMPGRHAIVLLPLAQLAPLAVLKHTAQHCGNWNYEH